MKSDKVIKCVNGWINSGGKFYSCTYGGHVNLAYELTPKVRPRDSWGVVNADEYLEFWGG